MRIVQIKSASLQIILLLTTILTLTSCCKSKEDESTDLEYKVRVSISYISTKAREGIKDTDIKRVDLFVFDSEGKYVKRQSDLTPNISNNYFMEVPLKQGNYSFVVWTNLGDDFTILPANYSKNTNIQDMELKLNRNQNLQIKTNIAPLMFGKSKQVSIKPIVETQQVSIPIIQNVNTINVEVQGLLPSSDTYELVIADNNGRYDFLNNILEDSEILYHRTIQFAENKLKSSTTVMKLASDRNPVIRLHNQSTDKLIREDNLIELIHKAKTKGADIDFDQTNEYDIVFIIANSTITIEINGWPVVKDGFYLN